MDNNEGLTLGNPSYGVLAEDFEAENHKNFCLPFKRHTPPLFVDPETGGNRFRVCANLLTVM
jgi:hypothetical protein